MKSARFIMLTLCFFIDIKVRAEECTGQTTSCVIHTSAQRKIFKENARQFVLGPQSLLENKNDGLQLVKGSLYIEAEKVARLISPFGSFECEEDCRALLERQVHSVKIQSIKGMWRIRRRGDTHVYGLPPGMEMSLGRVELDGVAEMEFPQSIPWDSTIKMWARLFPGSPEDFKESVSEFRALWREAVEAATDLQRREAGRTIASHEAELEKQRARQRAQAREDESLRNLFREKNNIYP